MNEFTIKAIDKEIKRLQLNIGLLPLIVISSDNLEIQQCFINKLSNMVTVIDDYELYGYGKMDLINRWSNSNLLLLNFEQKLSKYANSHKKYYGEEDWHHVYHALIDYRDWFRKYSENTMIIVCGNKTRIDMCMDAQLRCCIDFVLIDNKLLKPETFYSDLLQQTDNSVLQNDK